MRDDHKFDHHQIRRPHARHGLVNIFNFNHAVNWEIFLYTIVQHKIKLNKNASVDLFLIIELAPQEKFLILIRDHVTASLITNQFFF